MRCIPISGSSCRSSSRRSSHRHVQPGQVVCDPFAGSGTTLVEAASVRCPRVRRRRRRLQRASRARQGARCDPDVVERDLLATLADLDGRLASCRARRSRWSGAYLQSWFAPVRSASCSPIASSSRGRSDRPPTCSGSCSRVPRRSARLTPHYDLDFPRRPPARALLVPQAPARVPAGRRRRAVPAALHARHRAPRPCVPGASRRRRVAVQHADARVLDWGESFDGLLTSPPYPGRIDYHEQHRYAFELLELDSWSDAEIGAPGRGLSRAAVGAYVEDMVAVFTRARAHLRSGAPVVVVVDDPRGLFPGILERAGLEPDPAPPPSREPAHRQARGRVLRAGAARSRLTVSTGSLRLVNRVRPVSRGSGRGVSLATIAARCGSSHGGRITLRPSSSTGPSTVKPGPSVASSNRTPPGSRK